MQVTRLPLNVIPLTGLSEQIQVLSVNTSISENYPETLRGSYVRSQEPGMQESLAIPQVDGPPSIPSRNQRVRPDNVKIGPNYPCDGTYL